MSNLPQEFSNFGCGDYRLPSAQVRTGDGFNAVDAKYVSHKIFRGKPQLAGLPASFAADDEAETLEVTLRDDVIGVEFILDHSVFEKLPVVARSVRAVNCGSAPVTVERLASLTLDYRSGTELDLVSFPGGWTRERRPVRERVNPGIREFGSNRGLSSHQSNPFFILCDPETTEDHGRAWGQMLVYSGNFLAEVERDQYDMTHVQFGLNPERFSWKLEPGESFQSPEALTAFSASGLETLSHTFHDFLRRHVIRQTHVYSHRPVVINNWEATRFKHNEEICRRRARLFALHLNDNDGVADQHQSPFMGTVDWQRVAEVIADSSYDKPLSYEICMKATPYRRGPLTAYPSQTPEDQRAFLEDAHERYERFGRMYEEIKRTLGR